MLWQGEVKSVRACNYDTGSHYGVLATVEKWLQFYNYQIEDCNGIDHATQIK